MRLIHLYSLLFCSLFVIRLQGQPEPSLAYYLPADAYDPAIPTPEEVLGFEVGAWHLSHDQVVRYMYALAAASDRVTLQAYGRTFEQRPQLLLTITHPDNHGRLEAIRREHLALSDPSQSVAIADQPVMVYMGFSVHGNEPSGGNASVLMAYYLAASKSAVVAQQLRQAVVLLDPVFNPDGFQRFSTWANSNRSLTETADPATRELQETWPGGRTNHYWFDVNRDWLPAELPELRNRLPLYHAWKPNVLTDHHEMGSNSTFFFQPGIPTRNHPLIPEDTYVLTERLGRYHAAFLDSLGSLYFTEESFDDFYFGKGSSYPDVNGAIGILFEQASSRGHAQETRFGVLRFAFTIRNQLTTARSTLAGAVALRRDLLEHQQRFYQAALQLAATDPVQAYAFGGSDPGTEGRAQLLVQLLQRHQIEVQRVRQGVPTGMQAGGSYYVVQARQPQYRLLKAIFEQRTTFTDSLFYDISAWTMPLAYGVSFTQLDARALGGLKLAPLANEPAPVPAAISDAKGIYALAMDWRHPEAPQLIHRLLARGLRMTCLTEGIQTQQAYLPAGTVLLPLENQDLPRAEVLETYHLADSLHRVPTVLLPTGYNPQGLELGSASLESLVRPSVALVVGDGVNAYEAGEVWHTLDQRVKMPVTLLDINELDKTNLSRYTHLMLVSGRYGLSESAEKALHSWVQAGGIVVALSEGVLAVVRARLGGFKLAEEDSTPIPTARYAEAEARRGARLMGGAIFETEVDTTHPLFFGWPHAHMAVFRDHTLQLELGENPFSSPARYTDKPLLAGYCHPINLKALAGAPAVQVGREGRGYVIAVLDDPVFRAFWHGTERKLLNAIFFGHFISRATTE